MNDSKKSVHDDYLCEMTWSKLAYRQMYIDRNSMSGSKGQGVQKFIVYIIKLNFVNIAPVERNNTRTVARETMCSDGNTGISYGNGTLNIADRLSVVNAPFLFQFLSYLIQFYLFSFKYCSILFTRVFCPFLKLLMRIQIIIIINIITCCSYYE